MRTINNINLAALVLRLLKEGTAGELVDALQPVGEELRRKDMIHQHT